MLIHLQVQHRLKSKPSLGVKMNIALSKLISDKEVTEVKTKAKHIRK